MDKIKSYLPWTVRIIIFILFVLSGVSKMLPIWAFEKQLVELGIATKCTATYLSRFIIALELAIGFAILQNHYIKKIVIPATILLLVAFCVHLGMQMYEFGPMKGNCGCFGTLLPMTPLEAFVKNILTIGMLVYLKGKVAEHDESRNRLIYLVAIFLSCLSLLFIIRPFCPCDKSTTPTTFINSFQLDSAQTDAIPIDTVKENILPITSDKIGGEKSTKVTDQISEKPTPAETEAQPKKVVSSFSKINSFSGKKVDLDQGKKIVCMFAPGCDHCRDAAKEIGALMKDKSFPPVYIVFMNEEAEKIPEFFAKAQCMIPYQVLEILDFWELIGRGKDTPAVFYQWNGNTMKSFDGTAENKFEAKLLKNALNEKYK